MPKGKKKVAAKPVEVVNAYPDDAQIRAEVELCNHRNAHYTAGELTCVLPKNHGGDHLGYVNGKPTAWSDAAGIPARKHA